MTTPTADTKLAAKHVRLNGPPHRSFFEPDNSDKIHASCRKTPQLLNTYTDNNRYGQSRFLESRTQDKLRIPGRKRPFSCRRWLSYKVEACNAAFNSPSGNGEVPLNATIYALGVGVEESLLKELENRQINDNYYELQSALQYALINEDSETKWCRGDDCFQKCTPYERE